MSRVPAEHEETNLFTLAGAFPYPPTPDIARSVRQRLGKHPQPRWSTRTLWTAAALLVALLALLAVPPVRAQLVEWLEIGAVRVFLGGATPTPAPGITPGLTPTLLPSLLDLEGETSLDSARRLIDFPVMLPAYPPDLGLPDYIFVQGLDAPFVILVWADDLKPDEVLLSLQMITPGSMAAEKWNPASLLQTTVNGNPAAWVTGPYLLQLRNGDLEMRRLIEGNVLVWERDGVTYRLETRLPVDEAVKIAESLK